VGLRSETVRFNGVGARGHARLAVRQFDLRRGGAEWLPVEIDIAQSCPDTSDLHGLTISVPSATLDLMVDEIRFE
jgi:hypothetical protein